MPSVENDFINFIRISLVKVTGKKGFLLILCAKKYRSSAERLELRIFVNLISKLGRWRTFGPLVFNVMKIYLALIFQRYRGWL